MPLQADYDFNKKATGQTMEVTFSTDIELIVDNPKKAEKLFNDYFNEGIVPEPSVTFNDLNRVEHQSATLNLSLLGLIALRSIGFQVTIDGGIANVDTLEGAINTVIIFLLTGNENGDFDGSPFSMVGEHYRGYIASIASWMIEKE